MITEEELLQIEQKANQAQPAPWKAFIEGRDGLLTRKNLIESTFTLLHPEGIRRIFTPKEIEEVLSLTEKVLAA